MNSKSGLGGGGKSGIIRHVGVGKSGAGEGRTRDADGIFKGHVLWRHGRRRDGRRAVRRRGIVIWHGGETATKPERHGGGYFANTEGTAARQ